MPLLGATVGNIRILERLGRGGMGDVYVGLDEKLQRRVALKVIRPDRRLDAEARGRFLREARILSQLDDPKICRIFDYLQTPEEDFLVLELIEGESLRRLLDRGRPARETALAIAEQLAEVLVVAHAKGVIHRDLKPDNVMLTPDGGIKVLDFGLARSFGEPVIWVGRQEETQELRQRTELGVVVGTPSSMSPEQARGERITAASDMFSYGLLLQELFTGQPAYDRTLPPQALLNRASQGMTREIVGTTRDVAALIARLEALAPEDRPTAREARDRLRWIRARPGRWLRRSLIGLAFAVGAAFVVAAWIERGQKERAAVAARQEAEEALAFVVDLFEVADPAVNGGRDISAREILDVGAQRLREQEAMPPLARARLLDTVASVYRRLGRYREAAGHFSQALALREAQLGGRDPLVAESLDHLAVAYWNQGRYDEAVSLLESAVAILEAAPGEDLLLATAINDLGNVESDRGRRERARELYQRALALREKTLGPRDYRVGQTLHNLGVLLLDAGDAERAEEPLARALGIVRLHFGADHPSVGRILNSLGRCAALQGRTADAEDAFRRALEVDEKVLGPSHPLCAWPLVGLARLHIAAGREDEAEPLLRRALALRVASLPADHPDLLETRGLLADLLRRVGRASEAEALSSTTTPTEGSL